jgi:hypothetical protein
VAHEIVHSIHRSKELGVILKLDFKKAYDRVNIDFMLEILRVRDFWDKWIGWISSIVIDGFVCVLANGDESPTFKIGRGKGDPLSLLLFNMVVDALTKMLAKPSSVGLVKGLLGQFRP